MRYNGRAFEAIAARLEHRTTCDLYHSALVVEAAGGRVAIEMAPIPDGDGAARGVVAEGPVGSRRAGRWRLFRYEVRCRPDGVIPDLAEAVESPQRLTDDAGAAQRVLELVPEVPRLVWGRDELGAGEMWNSNSLTSWLIARSGLDPSLAHLPRRGRAPGWQAGLAAAARQGR